MNPRAIWVINLGCFALAIGGVVAAITLLLLPLPPVTAGRFTVAWCGPGATSDNAIQVRLDPGIVNTGSIPGAAAPSQAEQQTLVAICTGAADTRITEAAITTAVALALGIGIPLIARRVRAGPPGGTAQTWLAPRPGG
jgi:hypothetical protein